MLDGALRSGWAIDSGHRMAQPRGGAGDYGGRTVISGAGRRVDGRDELVGGEAAMSALALLKSPQTIGMLLSGVAVIALIWSWHSRGQQIETLEARLDTCSEITDRLDAATERMQRSIETQNSAVEALESEKADMASRLADARQSLQAARAEAERRIEDIEAATPTVMPADATADQKEIQLCRDARRLLVR